MAVIRVSTGEKHIEVNDNGDYITLNLNDNAFLDRFFALHERIQGMVEELAGREAELRASARDAGAEGLDSSRKEIFSLYKEAGGRIRAEVDTLFGEYTCQKVFGDITPSFELFFDFFEQLLPYLEEFAKEKAQRMRRYSAARTGNV